MTKEQLYAGMVLERRLRDYSVLKDALEKDNVGYLVHHLENMKFSEDPDLAKFKDGLLKIVEERIEAAEEELNKV